ncbi:MAG: hypothetical protein ACWGMZ_09560 [Thermoguttaceae bacterium]
MIVAFRSAKGDKNFRSSSLALGQAYYQRHDLKIAAGPVTLALTDICVILFYFTLAMLLL